MSVRRERVATAAEADTLEPLSRPDAGSAAEAGGAANVDLRSGAKHPGHSLRRGRSAAARLCGCGLEHVADLRV